MVEHLDRVVQQVADAPGPALDTDTKHVSGVEDGTLVGTRERKSPDVTSTLSPSGDRGAAILYGNGTCPGSTPIRDGAPADCYTLPTLLEGRAEGQGPFARRLGRGTQRTFIGPGPNDLVTERCPPSVSTQVGPSGRHRRQDTPGVWPFVSTLSRPRSACRVAKSRAGVALA